MKLVQKDLFDALEFSAHMHRKQRRKGASGIPYINHPIEVANMLVQKLTNASPELIIAAILHDVIEDTDAVSDDIMRRYGPEVLKIVEEVTDDMSLPSSVRKEMQIGKAASLSYGAKCIKIADKACNIRDILYTRLKWTRRRKIDYVLWAMRVIGQIRDTNEILIQTFDEIVREAAIELDYPFNEKNAED